MVTHEKILIKFEAEIDSLNSHFAQFEKIKKFKLLGNPWNVETGELTPTLKLKRKIIHSNYKIHIEAFYSD